MNQPNTYNPNGRQARTLDDMVNMCAVMQHKQVRYWKTTNEIAKLFIATAGEFITLNSAFEQEIERIAVLYPDLGTYHEKLIKNVNELKRVFELWYEEVVMNREELEAHEPYRNILRTKFTEEQVKAKLKECDELLNVETGEKGDGSL